MKNKGRDYSQLLIVAALLVTLPRFAGAFIAADMTTIPDWVSTALSVGMGISGLGMGILDVLGVAYVFDGWRRSMPGNGKPWPFRYKILTGFVAALFVVGIGILSPFTVSRMRGHTMSVTLPGFLGWLWSVLVIASPYLLIGGIVTGQSGIVTVNHDAAEAPKNATEKTGEVAYKKYSCPMCSEKCDTSSALANHIRWKHPKNGKTHLQPGEEMVIIKPSKEN